MINVVLAFMLIASFLVAIIIHEYGHALVATMLGDPTPRTEGRLSLSLRSHIDPLGTILCVILAFFQVAAGPVGLGWGRPVKSDPWKLRGGPNGGTLLVALGGIIMNLIFGVIFSILLRVLPDSLTIGATNGVVPRIPQLITVLASVNFCLAIFNLIPLYPLDGYQILYTLLPSRQAVGFARSASYGPFIILLVIFLLPFLGQISMLSDFPLFRISYYILQGSLKLITLASGLPDILVSAFYYF